jgi:capsular polysaccharide biosynthesis protein
MVRSASVIAGEVGSFSMNAIFAEPGLGVITVAARNRLNNLRYVVGMKTFTRTVTDAFQHHQRRIVASETHRTAPWHVDFQVLNEALDSMPEIPDIN